MTIPKGCNPVPGFPGYIASRWGEIFSNKRGGEWRMLKPRENKWGYLRVCLYCEGGKRFKFVHRVVAMSFHIEGAGPELRHLDGDPSNNCVGNLRWGTAKENAADKEGHGRVPRGEIVGKFSDDEVRRAIRMVEEGMPRALVAKQMGCNRSTVTRWVNKKIRKEAAP